MTLPTVQVLLDNGAGTFPFDITSKVMQINGFSFSRGRDDWQEAVTAGDVQSLTLINSDGRFSPGSTFYATPSPIEVDQQIRIKETVNGTTFTRFTGYVKGWPVSWPATVATHSTVTLTVTDAQARAERRVLRSVVDEEIAEDTPAAHYALAEPEGSQTAADSSGNQEPALAIVGAGAEVVFGTATGPGTDGQTAATFAAGKFLQATIDFGSTPTAVTLSAYFASTVSPSILMRLYNPATPSALQTVTVGIGGTRVRASNASSTLQSGTGFNDGLIHHVAVTIAAGGSELFVDGVSVASSAMTTTLSQVMILEVGGSVLDWTSASGTFFDGAANWTGSTAHAAVFNSALSAPRIAAQSAAGQEAGVLESGTARLTRLASYAGLTLGTLDTSLTTVPFIDFTGRSAWDAIQEVADAELGSVYIDGSGNLTFHNRNDVVAKTAPDLSIDRQYVSPDVQPTQDDQQIVNHLETTAAGTGITQLVNDTASEATHGRYPDSKTYLVQTDAEALDRGNWIVDNFAEPSTRFGTLTIDLFRMTAAQAAATLAAVDIDAWIRVTNFPSQTPGGATVDVIVQGYREEVTDKTWKLACNVVARSLFSPVWILGDATAGVLGTTTRLYV